MTTPNAKPYRYESDEAAIMGPLGWLHVSLYLPFVEYPLVVAALNEAVDYGITSSKLDCGHHRDSLVEDSCMVCEMVACERERVKVLEEALKFYADEKNWVHQPGYSSVHKRNAHVDVDKGERAREALAPTSGEGGEEKERLKVLEGQVARLVDKVWELKCRDQGRWVFNVAGYPSTPNPTDEDKADILASVTLASMSGADSGSGASLGRDAAAASVRRNDTVRPEAASIPPDPASLPDTSGDQYKENPSLHWDTDAEALSHSEIPAPTPQPKEGQNEDVQTGSVRTTNPAQSTGLSQAVQTGTDVVAARQETLGGSMAMTNPAPSPAEAGASEVCAHCNYYRSQTVPCKCGKLMPAQLNRLARELEEAKKDLEAAKQLTQHWTDEAAENFRKASVLQSRIAAGDRNAEACAKKICERIFGQVYPQLRLKDATEFSAKYILESFPASDADEVKKLRDELNMCNEKLNTTQATVDLYHDSGVKLREQRDGLLRLVHEQQSNAYSRLGMSTEEMDGRLDADPRCTGWREVVEMKDARYEKS